MKSAREMQVNAREMYGSGCKVPGLCMGVGVKYHGEWRGMQVERIGVVVKCKGNAGECQGNVR